MTNSSKAHDLIQHEAPSADVPDAAHGHMPSMPLDPSMTAVAQGHVEGAWSIAALGRDWMPEEVFVLPEGATMQIEKGTAIRVQSDSWHHCEFPQSGMLHGPAVWAPAEAADESQLLSEVCHPITGLFFYGGLIAGATGSVVSLGGYIPDIVALFAVAAIVSPLTALGVTIAGTAVLHKASPLRIASVNKRVSKTLRVPRSVLGALGAPQPHLKLVAPDQPMDVLDLEIRGHLESYHAQRARLVAKRISGSPLMEHTSAMLEEISLRLRDDNAALRRDDLRRTYLELIQRAEADVSLALEKKDTEAADALIEDMSTLLRQMDRHKR